MENSTPKITITSILESRAIIPESSESIEQFASYSLKDQTLETNPIITQNFQDILTTVVDSNINDGNITVNIASILSSNNIIENFELRYGFSLNNSGTPQINIFILLDNHIIPVPEPTDMNISINLYQVMFKNTIDLSNFKTVKVFIVSDNIGIAETSRSVIADIKNN